MWTLPRAMPKGESRPGFLPVRLCMLMEVMLHAFNFHGGFECIDLFAGKCAISKAYVAKGLRACALDILIDPEDDILTSYGFLRFLWAAMNLKEGALLVAGILCSTWSVVNRGTSGRTESNPLGRTWYRSVQEGNLMVCRMVLILYVCIHRKAHFLLENPVNSLIFHHPRLRFLLSTRGWFEINTWMGMFGAPTWKPVRLVSSSSCVHLLQRKLNRWMKGHLTSLRCSTTVPAANAPVKCDGG